MILKNPHQILIESQYKITEPDYDEDVYKKRDISLFFYINYNLFINFNYYTFL